MKSSTLLRRARKLIEKEHEEYICVALQEQHHPKARALQEEINKRMGVRKDVCLSLETWLARQGIIPQYTPTPKLEAQMRAYRLRWLDALIKEYKAKGD